MREQQIWLPLASHPAIVLTCYYAAINGKSKLERHEDVLL